MPLFLYKVKKAHRWYPESARDFLQNDDVPADSVGDIQTKGNRLSVWEVAQDRTDVVRIVRAIAVNADRIDDAGYLLLDSHQLVSVGIDFLVTEGATPDMGINARHRDLILSGKKLVALVKLFLEQGELGEITKRELQESVLQGIQRQELPESCRKKIK